MYIKEEIKNKLLRKCPNCGASIEHNYNHRCRYCRTYLHMTDETIKEIDNCEYRVDEVFIERSIIRHEFIMTIMGWTTPRFHTFEESINGYAMVVSGDETMKRVGYRVAIPLELVYERKENEFIDYVLRSIPPELCNSYNENLIIEKCYEFLNKGIC